MNTFTESITQLFHLYQNNRTVIYFIYIIILKLLEQLERNSRVIVNLNIHYYTMHDRKFWSYCKKNASISRKMLLFDSSRNRNNLFFDRQKLNNNKQISLEIITIARVPE